MTVPRRMHAYADTEITASDGRTAAFCMPFFEPERIFHEQERYLPAACMVNARFFGYNINESTA